MRKRQGTNRNYDRGNRLIHRAVLSALPPSFATALSSNFTRMVDIVLAGMFLTPVSIACIGLGGPVTTFLTAIADIFGQGAGLSIAINIGRGDKEKLNRTLSAGIMVVIILCLLFTSLVIVFVRPLIAFLGGDGEEVVGQAAAYMSATAIGMVFSTLKYLLMKIARSYGMNGITFITQIIAMASNVVFSVFLIKTTELGIAALGLGTAISSFLTAPCPQNVYKRSHVSILVM